MMCGKVFEILPDKNQKKYYSTEFWKYILTIHYSNTLTILKDALYNYKECRKQVFTKAILKILILFLWKTQWKLSKIYHSL